MPFQAGLADWLRFDLDLERLESQVSWKDFGNGSRMGKLARDGDTGLVLYHVRPDADEDAFQPHTHTGGEMYLVLKGTVHDEEGEYPEGSLVWMEPGSRHTPKTKGDTYILTLWPKGVKG